VTRPKHIGRQIEEEGGAWERSLSPVAGLVFSILPTP
jgi:hypothetical protein